MKQNVLTIQENTIILLGYVGDESSTLIRIPVATFFSRYGDGGEFELIHTPPCESYGHPVTGVTVVDGFVEWIVGSEELSTHGHGELQVVYECDGGVTHSKIWETVILRSLEDTGDIPAPWVPWVRLLYEYKSDAEEAASHYPYIDQTTNNWVIWDVTLGEWVDTGVSARGISSYTELSNKPTINGVEINGDMDLSDIKAVYDDTTEHWNSQLDFIPRFGAVVIYSDHAVVDGDYVPGIKVGDGSAYLIDLPFVGDDIRQMIMAHIANASVHVSAADRESWDNKVTCYVELIEGDEYLIHFSKE